jgi:hypothetical protein
MCHMDTALCDNHVIIPKLAVCRAKGDRVTDHDEGNQSSETIEAIILYMHQIDISHQTGPSGAEVRFFDAKAAHSTMVITAKAILMLNQISMYRTLSR